MFAQRVHAESHAFPFGPDIYIPIDGKACLIGAAHITKADTDSRVSTAACSIYGNSQFLSLDRIVTICTNMHTILHAARFCLIADGQRMVFCIDSKIFLRLNAGLSIHRDGNILIHDILAIFFLDAICFPVFIFTTRDCTVKVYLVCGFTLHIGAFARLRKGDIPCL